jgi:CYTH domain-containing protein
MGKYLGRAADVSAKLEKYARIERERRFLLRALPDGLSVTDHHLQIFYNNITGTRLRRRTIRVPATREWTWKLTQKFAPPGDAAGAPPDYSRTVITNIYLSEYEYETFSVFEGNELRKNRYPYVHEGRTYSVDVFLGALHGLILAEIEFATDEEMQALAVPSFAALEVTNEEMFTGGKLVDSTADAIREELSRRALVS